MRAGISRRCPQDTNQVVGVDEKAMKSQTYRHAHLQSPESNKSACRRVNQRHLLCVTLASEAQTRTEWLSQLGPSCLVRSQRDASGISGAR